MEASTTSRANLVRRRHDQSQVSADPPTSPEPTGLAVPRRLDRPLSAHGIRRAPRHRHRDRSAAVRIVEFDYGHYEGAVYFAIGAQLALDAAVLWPATTGSGASGCAAVGWERGGVDAGVVADGPDGVLDAGAVRGMVRVCDVLECRSGIPEQLADLNCNCRAHRIAVISESVS